MHYKIQYYILKILHPCSEINCVNTKDRYRLDYEYQPTRYTVYYTDNNTLSYVRRG